MYNYCRECKRFKRDTRYSFGWCQVTGEKREGDDYKCSYGLELENVVYESSKYLITDVSTKLGFAFKIKDKELRETFTVSPTSWSRENIGGKQNEKLSLVFK